MRVEFNVVQVQQSSCCNMACLVCSALLSCHPSWPLFELHVSFLLLARFVTRENVSFCAVEIVVDVVCGSCCCCSLKLLTGCCSSRTWQFVVWVFNSNKSAKKFYAPRLCILSSLLSSGRDRETFLLSSEREREREKERFCPISKETRLSNPSQSRAEQSRTESAYTMQFLIFWNSSSNLLLLLYMLLSLVKPENDATHPQYLANVCSTKHFSFVMQFVTLQPCELLLLVASH